MSRLLTKHGVMVSTVVNIINYGRMWDKHPVARPTMFRKIQPAMREVKGDWEASKAPYGNLPYYDAEDLTLTGFELQSQHVPSKSHWGTIESIPFKDLAIDVRKFPKSDDALDLTRCIQYAVEHPEEDWSYPSDFERLTDELGGPARARLEHCHATANHRWATWHLRDHDEQEWVPENNDEDSDSDSDGDSSEEEVETLHERSFKINLTTEHTSMMLNTDETVHTAQIRSLERRVLRSTQGGHHAFLSLVNESHLPSITGRGILVPRSFLRAIARPQTIQAPPPENHPSLPSSIPSSLKATTTPVQVDKHRVQPSSSLLNQTPLLGTGNSDMKISGGRTLWMTCLQLRRNVHMMLSLALVTLA